MKTVIKVFGTAFLLTLVGMLAFNGALFADPPAETEHAEVTLYVSGMTWGGCVNNVRSALQSLEGVQSADVSLSAENAVVVYQPGKTSLKDMTSAVKKAGYGITGNSDPKPVKKEHKSKGTSEGSSSDDGSETTLSTTPLN